MCDRALNFVFIFIFWQAAVFTYPRHLSGGVEAQPESNHVLFFPSVYSCAVFSPLFFPPLLSGSLSGGLQA